MEGEYKNGKDTFHKEEVSEQQLSIHAPEAKPLSREKFISAPIVGSPLFCVIPRQIESLFSDKLISVSLNVAE